MLSLKDMLVRNPSDLFFLGLRKSYFIKSEYFISVPCSKERVIWNDSELRKRELYTAIMQWSLEGLGGCMLYASSAETQCRERPGP